MCTLKSRYAAEEMYGVIFSIILDIVDNSLNIPKGQCIGREALCVPMHSGNKAILITMTPHCLKYPNSVQEQER